MVVVLQRKPTLATFTPEYFSPYFSRLVPLVLLGVPAASTEASPQLRGLPARDFGWQYTPGGSIHREVVCGLRPASKPKAEEDEVTSVAHLRNLPSGNLSRGERDLY